MRTLILFFTENVAKVGTLLTKSRAFRKLVDWAYGVCDANKTNHINQAELYAGLLLVHIKLAKFAGAAACMVRISLYF
jgi:hypothetical protein